MAVDKFPGQAGVIGRVEGCHLTLLTLLTLLTGLAALTGPALRSGGLPWCGRMAGC